jgi:hypothetical protein
VANTGDTGDAEDGDDLVIEVDGEGVHLDTLDAPSVLELAVSYLLLLSKVADERGEEIEFVGLSSVEKCGQLRTTPTDPELARLLAVDATQLLASRERPGYGLQGVVQRVRQARAALPTHYTASVKVRGFERVITAEPVSRLDEAPFATASVRAELLRVGGIRPRAAFKSKAENRPFHLDVTKGQAERLAAHLYKTIDIVASVGRDREGNIEIGTLLEFYALSDGDPRAAWAEFLKERGPVSLDELLDRGRGSHGNGS